MEPRTWWLENRLKDSGEGLGGGRGGVTILRAFYACEGVWPSTHIAEVLKIVARLL